VTFTVWRFQTVRGVKLNTYLYFLVSFINWFGVGSRAEDVWITFVHASIDDAISMVSQFSMIFIVHSRVTLLVVICVTVSGIGVMLLGATGTMLKSLEL
jgi:hypothetical protein